MAQDVPSAAELLQAVREWLAGEARPALDGRLAFHARVAERLLATVERELTLGPGLDAEEVARARDLLGPEAGDEPRALEVELARRIRDGSLDDRRAEVVAHVRATVRAKLAIADPDYIGSADPDDVGSGDAGEHPGA